MWRLIEPSHLDLCCLQKSIIIACGSEGEIPHAPTPPHFILIRQHLRLPVFFFLLFFFFLFFLFFIFAQQTPSEKKHVLQRGANYFLWQCKILLKLILKLITLLNGCFNLYHHLGKLMTNWWYFCHFSPEKKALTSYANCLIRKQFEWKSKYIYLEK